MWQKDSDGRNHLRIPDSLVELCEASTLGGDSEGDWVKIKPERR